MARPTGRLQSHLEMSEERRILIVDDNYGILDSVKSMLESTSSDYRVVGVPSAEEGILEIRKRPFDLLITDIYLPGMSGAELIVRVNKLWPELPIIVITGHAEKMSASVAASSGIVSYFEKPVKPGELIRAVKAVFQDEVFEEPGDYVEAKHGLTPSVPLALRFLIEGLRADTGATEVLVGTINGRTLYATKGRNSALSVLIDNFSEAILGMRRLSDRMGCSSPATFQSVSDGQIELFLSSNESGNLIAFLYDAPSRITEISTIKSKAENSLIQVERIIASEPKDAGYPSEEEIVKAAIEVPGVSPEVDVTEDEESEALIKALKEVSAQKALGIFELPELDSSTDVDAFWDDVLSEESGDGEEGAAVDFDEAIRRGLIPPGFEAQD